MVKLSVSQAARLVGVSRTDLQNKINHNQLQTHEGYLTMDDLRQAYPAVNPEAEQDKLRARAELIKDHAIHKTINRKRISQKNQRLIDQSVKDLQEQNKQLYKLIDELSNRLAILEHHCHQKDKASLHQLQDWLKSQTQH